MAILVRAAILNIRGKRELRRGNPHILLDTHETEDLNP